MDIALHTCIHLVCFVGFCRQYWFQIPLHLNGFKYFIPFFLFQPFLSVLKIIFLLKGPTLVNIQLLNRWLLFCFTFLNSLETLSCDSSVGCRGGLVVPSLQDHLDSSFLVHIRLWSKCLKLF